jgi:hypothetical protein
MEPIKDGRLVVVRERVVASVACRADDAGHARSSNLACRVCRSLERAEVERRLLECLDDVSLLAELGDEFGLSVESLRAHIVGGHSLTRPQAGSSVVRGEVGNRADIGDSVSNLADGQVDTGEFLAAVVDATAERLASGALRPKLADGIAATRLMRTTPEPTTDARYTHDEMICLLVIYMGHVAAVLTREQMDHFATRIRNDPEFVAMAEEFEARRGEEG